MQRSGQAECLNELERTNRNAVGRDEMDGQPEGRECGMQSSQWSPTEAERHRQCEALGAAREPGGTSQSFCPADLMLYVIHV